MNIQITNFGSFEGEHSLTLDRGVFFITGENKDTFDKADSNGAGKSTILNAIVWCLYGKTPTGVKKDDVINDSSDSCSVLLKYNSVEIRRSKRRNKSETLAFSPCESLTTDLKENQAKLIEIIGIPFELFTHSRYIGRDTISRQFLMTTPTERLRMLEFLFSGKEYEVGYKQARVDRQKIEKNIQELYYRTDSYNSNIQVFQREIVNHKASINQLKSSRKKAQDNLIDRLNESTYTLDKLRNTINDRLSEENKLKNVERNLGLRRFSPPSVKGVCPTCYQKIDDSLIESLQNEARRIDKEWTAAYKEWNEVQKYLAALREEYSGVKREQELLEYEVSKQQDTPDNNIDMLEGSLRNYEAQIEELKEGIKENNKEIQKLSDSLQYVQFWEVGFSPRGIRTMLLDDIKQRLEHYTQQWTWILLDGYEITFPCNETGIDIITKIRGSEISIGKLSTGERWRVNIAVLLGLASMLCNVTHSALDFLLLDDILGELDETGIIIVKELIQAHLPKYFPIVLITVPLYVENAIKVVKSGGQSRITKEAS